MKKSDMVTHTCNPSTEEVETVGTLGLTGQPADPSKCPKLGRLVSKSKVDSIQNKNKNKNLEVSLWSPQIQAFMYMIPTHKSYNTNMHTFTEKIIAIILIA